MALSRLGGPWGAGVGSSLCSRLQGAPPGAGQEAPFPGRHLRLPASLCRRSEHCWKELVVPVTHADGPRGHSLPGQAQGGRLVGLVVGLQAAHARTAQRPGLEPRPPQAWVRAGGPGTLVLAALQSLEALPTRASVSPSASWSVGETAALLPGAGASDERGRAALPSQSVLVSGWGAARVSQGRRGPPGALLGPLAAERLASAAPGEGGPGPWPGPAWAPGACVPGRGAGRAERTSGEIGLPVYP